MYYFSEYKNLITMMGLTHRWQYYLEDILLLFHIYRAVRLLKGHFQENR